MEVGAIWITYVVVTVILLILFLIPSYGGGLGRWLGAFLAFLIGALVVFVLTFNINRNNLSPNDNTWLTILEIVAYGLAALFLLILIIGGIWMFARKRRNSKVVMIDNNGNGNGDMDGCDYKATVVCDTQTGECAPKKEKIKCDGKSVKFLYI